MQWNVRFIFINVKCRQFPETVIWEQTSAIFEKLHINHIEFRADGVKHHNTTAQMQCNKQRLLNINDIVYIRRVHSHKRPRIAHSRKPKHY